jgi:HSP20 family protein
MSGAPSADLYETQNGLELVMELPGVSPHDVHLSLKGEVLSVSGERIESRERDEGGYRVRERRSGAFERSFVLPPGIEHEKIEARFDKGVLTVAIPRKPEAETSERRIPIRG